ncbi:hypothetical protein L873DRAFT_1790374 [Choiromyces venosus 120613-1]|uniref:Uncharacterized protein n=1 Tax=Choiromyces venosus 120613-1 TaxID=1336337 RepID=A0A3N4JJH0_9PEZI|nr:hypothetical protein L873DRAFT_1790374 [Choiromyces venosus 120613-1]
MSGGGVAALVIFLLLLFAGAGWIIFTQLRARRLGLPAPTWRSYIPFLSSNSRTAHAPASYEPSRSGLVGKITGVFGSNNAGYSGSNVRAQRTRERDLDGEWDDRIEEEEEGGYGAGYGHNGGQRGRGGAVGLGAPGFVEERGRSRSREPPRDLGRGEAPLPYPEELNPFAVDVRLQGVRERDEGFGGVGVKGGRASVDSERRSAFRESIN